MLFVCSIWLITACTNETATPDPSAAILQDGVWRITWYWDQDKDETSDFSGYEFYFRDDQTLDAIGNGNTISGSWQMLSDDGTQRLVLYLTDTKPLSGLNDDWVIIESSQDRIRLRDDNDTHLEELTFERIR
jgi:hypothetical protein